jgi:putrescine transport system permease protein
VAAAGGRAADPLSRIRRRIGGRALVIALPFAWLALFFLAPFAIVFKLSFSHVLIAIPPYAPLIEWPEGGSAVVNASLDNYVLLAGDRLYWTSGLTSLRIAALATAIALVVGYPLAYAIARAPAEWRFALVTLVMLPFWTSFLIRVYALIGILKPEGLLNHALIGLGLLDEPLAILNTEAAVYVGIVYSYLPYMVLPIAASLIGLDRSLLEAAADLGCRPWKAFWTITAPLSLPGVVAGCFLVFIPAVGEFIVPDLLGGSDTLMIGKTLWTEFFNNRDWPLASAVAVVLLALLVGPIVAFQRATLRRAAGP